MAKKLQSIYEYLSEYKKENIDLVISMLTEEEKELIRLRYGEDLENPQTSKEWNTLYNQKFYGSLLPRMKRILFDLHVGKTKIKMRKIKEIVLPKKSDDLEKKVEQVVAPTIEVNKQKENKVQETEVLQTIAPVPQTAYTEESTCQSINPHQIDLFSFLRSASFLEITNELSVKEAIIICLRLGYVDDKYYETKTIANFFNISEDEVRNITKKALNLYKERINSVIDQAIFEQNSKISENNSPKPQILCKTPTNNGETS